MSAAGLKIIRFGHSPDPDDAFMFYAFAKNKIPMQGFHVEHVVEDIERLNQRALGEGRRGQTPSDLLEVTAVSAHAYTYLADKYLVMRSGASLGDQYGPILVKRREEGRGETEEKNDIGEIAGMIRGKKIAIPGKLTTAYLVLQLFAGRDRACPIPTFEPVFTPFDQIFEAVETGKADLGLVIHEGQLTYAARGLEKILDLGVWWQQETGTPLVLGLDVIRRDLGSEILRTFPKLFKQSIEYALQNREPALEYALEFGRGIQKDLGDRFVGMYVNDYTVELGPKGTKGLCELLRRGHERGILPKLVLPEFV